MLSVKSKIDSTGSIRPNDRNVSIWKLFKYADSFDLWLMAFGTVGTIVDGITLPMALLVLSSMIDTTGNFGPGSTGNHFHYTINKVTIISFPLIDNETWFNIHDLWYNFIMNVYFNIGVFFNRCVYCCVSRWV